MLVVLLVGLLWCFWVVADSAQFSTLVTEVAEQSYVGTALTLQLAIGFVLTVPTIWLIPIVEQAAGWGPAFALLALGPLAGIVAMRALEQGGKRRKMPAKVLNPEILKRNVWPPRRPSIQDCNAQTWS
ncbi:hypothetical protein [Marinobacter salarius]